MLVWRYTRLKSLLLSTKRQVLQETKDSNYKIKLPELVHYF